jgi:hypothetical protein
MINIKIKIKICTFLLLFISWVWWCFLVRYCPCWVSIISHHKYITLLHYFGGPILGTGMHKMMRVVGWSWINTKFLIVNCVCTGVVNIKSILTNHWSMIYPCSLGVLIFPSFNEILYLICDWTIQELLICVLISGVRKFIPFVSYIIVDRSGIINWYMLLLWYYVYFIVLTQGASWGTNVPTSCRHVLWLSPSDVWELGVEWRQVAIPVTGHGGL